MVNIHLIVHSPAHLRCVFHKLIATTCRQRTITLIVSQIEFKNTYVVHVFVLAQHPCVNKTYICNYHLQYDPIVDNLCHQFTSSTNKVKRKSRIYVSCEWTRSFSSKLDRIVKRSISTNFLCRKIRLILTQTFFIFFLLSLKTIGVHNHRNSINTNLLRCIFSLV